MHLCLYISVQHTVAQNIIHITLFIIYFLFTAGLLGSDEQSCPAGSVTKARVTKESYSMMGPNYP